MSEIKYQGIEAIAKDGVYTAELENPMKAVMFATDGNYTVDEASKIYAFAPGVTVLFPEDTDVDAFATSFYDTLNKSKVQEVIDNITSAAPGTDNLDDLINKVDSIYEQAQISEDSLYNALSSEDNVYLVPQAEPVPGMFARAREYFTDLDGSQKMLLGIIGAASIGLSAMIYHDVQKNGGDVSPAAVEPAIVEPVQDTCESARAAYMTANTADRADLKLKIDEFCQ